MVSGDFSDKQVNRLKFIEFKLYFAGEISRSDLTRRFGLKDAAASRDLAAYTKAFPSNITFDSSAKVHRIGDGFAVEMLKSESTSSLLRALVHGMGDDFGGEGSSMVPCEFPQRLHLPDVSVLSVLSRAICSESVVEIEYTSKSGLSTRQIVPFSFVGNGLRWHVRAYDRRRGRFRDFVVNRISRARMLREDRVEIGERRENDDQWNWMLTLELVPHPDRPFGEMVQKEFQMEEGVRKVRTRAAFAGYLLRLWNVDCSPDHRLEGWENQLWLRNHQILFDVESAKIAPGIAGV